MIGFPTDPEQMYGLMRRELLRDRELKESFTMPAEYMFHDLPQHDIERTADPVSFTLSEMDRFGVEIGLVSLSGSREFTERALTEDPERFVGSLTLNANDDMDGIRELTRVYETWGIRAVSLFPHGVSPQVAIDAAQMYPIYAK